MPGTFVFALKTNLPAKCKVETSKGFTFVSFLHGDLFKMSKAIILVGVGGLLGSICRYLVSILFAKEFPFAFPFGTFAVNVLGCFLIGLFYGLSDKYNWFTPELRLFVTTGFCGGFTTFSSFAFENIKLLQTSEYLNFVMYSIGSFAFGLLAVFGGLAISKL